MGKIRVSYAHEKENYMHCIIFDIYRYQIKLLGKLI